ncbi:MAG: AAA family ATPase [Deltaproteobacteria bacterium]|jgi:general secretion pathway protein A|nr:AAA family ATPase [Deltaproteobacteria bacterium]
MYNTFFDLRKKPFKLVPNPEFLFLGKCHEEVLAHLTYATSQGDGFVEITGEVGTGKTTLCRVFLENLDKDIEAAFIFNSKLDSTQLLKAIHKELGIISIANGPVELTQDLNDFLLEKKSQGKSVILLIDEAQNLGKETLEQLRLLSNLETTSSKLLQIILVGQPELREILDSHEMRQLRQRINLSYHIYPMTQKETFDYITHRINITSRKPQTLFTRSAQKKIFQLTRGIPRLINIICDRALLVAYSQNQNRVTPSSVKVAIDELDINIHNQSHSGSIWKKTAMALFSIIFILSIFSVVFLDIPWKWRDKIKMDESKVKILNEQIITVSPLDSNKKKEPLLVVKESLPPEPVLADSPLIEKGKAKTVLSVIKDTATRANAFLYVASLWNSESMIHLNPLTQQIQSNVDFFKVAAVQNNLQILYLEKSQDLIEKLNFPVIFGFKLPGDPVKGFFWLDGITLDNEYIISSGQGEKKYKIVPEELSPYLRGDKYIIWKDNFGNNRIIAKNSSKYSIMALKLLLTEIGIPLVDMSPVYDTPVKQAIKQIQKKYGLVEDGLVGTLTKIVLLNEKKDYDVPRLNNTRELDQ